MKPNKKPIRTMISNSANTITTVAATISETASAVHDVVLIARVHLNFAKIEAEMESLSDLAELLNWDEATLKDHQQAVIDKYKDKE